MLILIYLRKALQLLGDVSERFRRARTLEKLTMLLEAHIGYFVPFSKIADCLHAGVEVCPLDFLEYSNHGI